MSSNQLHTHTGLYAFRGQWFFIINTTLFNGHSGRRGDEQIDRRRVKQLSCQSDGSHEKCECPEQHLSVPPQIRAVSNQAIGVTATMSS